MAFCCEKHLFVNPEICNLPLYKHRHNNMKVIINIFHSKVDTAWIFPEKIGHFFDQHFGRPKNFDKKFSTFCFDFCSTKNCQTFFFGSPISIPNDPKIPKITLRTACDHYKITNSEHEEKVSDFFPILP